MKIAPQTKYCNTCIMNEGHPYVQFDENGVCDLCNGTKLADKLEQYGKAAQKSAAFFDEISNPKRIKSSHYDCLLMLSGGKDSTYMLYRLINLNLRPLAFTVNKPYESHNAKLNIDKAVNRLNVEHIYFTPNLSGYRKMMKEVITRDNQRIFTCMHAINLPPEKFSLEKFPCIAVVT